MDVGSTQRFGTLLPLPLSPQTVEQEPLTEEERFRRAFEKDLRISPKSAPPQSSNVGARLAGRSMSCNDGSLGTMIKTKRTSLPAFMPTTEELPKRKGSLLDRLRPSKPEPEMQNRYIESLLKYDEWLLDSTEILANCCGNFSCISLNVPPGVIVGDFSEDLFQSLGACFPLLSDLDAKPTVLGKEVLEKDRKSLRNFILQIRVDEIWTRLFHEMVQRRYDKKNCKIFLSPTVCKALLMMRTQEEIDNVSMHLMSECTEIERQVRLIKFDLFSVLLHDERIASIHQLRMALIDAAHKVEVVAIRSCQNLIAFDALKGIPKRQELIAKWREKAKGMGSDHLDLEGIEVIAKECGFDITINPSLEDASLQNYQYVIEHYEKLKTICEVYN